MIRSGDYKLIRYYEGVPGRNEDELYDLARDPGEQRAAYLDPDWKPNEDWWGSMVVED